MKFTIKIYLIFSIFTAPLLSMKQEDLANELARVLRSAEQCTKEHFHQAMSHSIQNLHFDLSVLYNLSLSCKNYNESFNRGINHFMEHKFDGATLELHTIAQQYIAETDEDIKKTHANQFKNIFYIDPKKERRLCIDIILYNLVVPRKKYSLEDCIQIYSGNSLPNLDTSLSILEQKETKYKELGKCFIRKLYPICTQIMLFDKMVQKSLNEEKEDLQKNPLPIPILSMDSILYTLALHGTSKILQIILSHLQIAKTNLCHNKCLLAILNSAIVFNKHDLVKVIMKPNYNDRKAILELFLENTKEDKETGRPSLHNILKSLYDVDTEKPIVKTEAIKDAIIYFIEKNKTEQIRKMISQYYYDLRLLAQIIKTCVSKCSFEQKEKISSSFFDHSFFSQILDFDFTKQDYEASLCEILVAVLDLIYEQNANVHHAERQVDCRLAQKHRYFKGNNPYAKIIMLLINEKKDISTLMPSLVFCAEKYTIAKNSKNIDLYENYCSIFNALAKLVKEEQTPRDIDKFIEAQYNIKSFILSAIPFCKIDQKYTTELQNVTSNRHKIQLFSVNKLVNILLFCKIDQKDTTELQNVTSNRRKAQLFSVNKLVNIPKYKTELPFRNEFINTLLFYKIPEICNTQLQNSNVNKQKELVESCQRSKARLFFVGALLSSVIFSLIFPYIKGFIPNTV